MRRELNQSEIDAVFTTRTHLPQEPGSDHGDALHLDHGLEAFDFSRLDRIPKSQFRALHLLHEDFSRNLSSTLSAYLQSYVSMNLVSLEQIAYSEFIDGLSTPTCVAYISLRPFDNTAVIEVGMNLVFTLVELLLGGDGQSPRTMNRKVTEIEKNLLTNVLRVILRDLSEAWNSVAQIDFAVQSLASEPHMFHVLAPLEAVVVIAIECRIGTVSGLLNLAIPSIFIKRLRNKFEQLRQIRRVKPTQAGRLRMANLIRKVDVKAEARLDNMTINTSTLLSLSENDVLELSFPVEKPASLYLNGRNTCSGAMVRKGDKLLFSVRDVHPSEAPLTAEDAETGGEND